MQRLKIKFYSDEKWEDYSEKCPIEREVLPAKSLESEKRTENQVVVVSNKFVLRYIKKEMYEVAVKEENARKMLGYKIWNRFASISLSSYQREEKWPFAVQE